MAQYPLFPTGELVAREWVRSLDVDFQCDFRLPPKDELDWTNEGFVRIAGVVGGSPNNYIGLQRTVVTIESWADNEGNFPALPLAANNAQMIARSCDYKHGNPDGYWLDMPEGFYGVCFQEINVVGSVRQRPGNLGNRACYLLDVEIQWLPLDFIPTAGNVPTPTPIDLENLVFEFPVLALSWHVVHNLGFPPVLAVQDMDGNEIEGEVETSNSNNEFYVRFNTPTNGRVIVSR